MTGTRPKLSWSDLSGARVGLWGLGREGLANFRKLCAMGIEPVLVDDRPGAVAIGGSPVLTTGYGGLAALEKCDVVVKSPGISRYRPEVVRLEERGVPVAGGLGLWLQEADLTRVLLITGTKGKSTTAAVTGHLLTGLGHRCLVGGNIGQPPWDPVPRPGRPGGPAPGTSGSSRSPVTRPPTCPAQRRWWPLPRCTPITSTGTAACRTTIATSCPCAPSRGRI